MNKKRRMTAFVLLSLLMIFSLSGCKVSKKKVEKSSYYQELLKKYEQLQEQNKELQEESENQEKISEAEEKAQERAEKFLTKIERDQLVKMEIGYADSMEDSLAIDQASLLDIATDLAKKADLTSKYTPDQLSEEQELLYEYVLYDENNAIYELMIYEEDYVVFSDLPNDVYYIPTASALGDAFLKNRIDYPSSTTLHLMADSSLMADSKNRIYTHDLAVETAVYIRQMKKDKTSRKKVEEVWKKDAGFDGNDEADIYDYEPDSMTYEYYNHGDTLKLIMYERYFCLKNADGDESWYKADKAEIQGIKDILKKYREAKEAEAKESKKSSGSDTKSKEEESHANEIAEESVVSE